MLLSLRRIYFAPTYTIGRLSIPSASFECDTLEDTDRDANANGVFDGQEVKIYGKTAIPYGRYRIAMTQSPKFSPRYGDRNVPLLLDVPHFSGILIHSGNTPADTEGCILVGENKVKGRVINSTPYELELTKRCKAAIARKEKITIEIV